MYRDDAGRFGWKDLVNGAKKIVKKAVQIVNKYVVQPVVKWVNTNIVQPVVNFFTGGGSSPQQTHHTATNNASQSYQYNQNSYQRPAYDIPITKEGQALYLKRIEQERKQAAAEKTLQAAKQRIRKMCEGAGKLLDQVVKGSYSNNSSTGGTLAEILAGGIPILGDIGDVRDAVHGVQTGNWWEVGASGLGLIPILGGIAKEGVQSTIKEFDVNNYDGVNRDDKRLVRGSDGSTYYTNDHYDTFTKIK